MPLVAVLYLVAFVAVQATGNFMAIRKANLGPVLIADMFSAAVFAYLFAAFWHTELRHFAGWSAPVLFIMAIGWEIADSITRSIRTPDGGELSATERWVEPLVALLICLPAYVVSGLAVLM